jgi:hypothetical protein
MIDWLVTICWFTTKRDVIQNGKLRLAAACGKLAVDCCSTTRFADNFQTDSNNLMQPETKRNRGLTEEMSTPPHRATSDEHHLNRPLQTKLTGATAWTK